MLLQTSAKYHEHSAKEKYINSILRSTYHIKGIGHCHSA
jgi:hypothetical protein